MKQSLQLKLGQQLTMTPQLQQAIRLLQLSTMDLQQEIQEALETNPLLEVSEDDDTTSEAAAPDQQATDGDRQADGPLQSMEQAAGDESSRDADWETGGVSDSLPEDLPVDTQWDDLLPAASAPAPNGEQFPDSDFESRNSASESLREQLLWQLSLTRLSDTDRLIALTLIDATDANGRLVVSLEEIFESLAEHLEIDFDEVVAVLHRL
ncbi:MAG: RNA polymerase factor sigma-54, partial [Halioglobus sp.]|nr:RNA polymerase factor sigma-54 [Halioglobus sp.]